MKKLLLCAFMSAVGLGPVCGQTFVEHVEQQSGSNASVKVQQSSEIDDLVNGKIPLQTTPTKKNNTENSVANNTNNTTSGNNTVKKPSGTTTDNNSSDVDQTQKVTKVFTRGVVYRVQAYAGGNSREAKQQAYAIQDKIRRALPNVTTSVHFQSPRWICTAGNCRSSEEAKQLLQQIKGIGIPSAIIIRRSIKAQR